MCECRADIEKRLVDHYAPKLPDSRQVEAKLMGYAITIGASLGIQPYMPVEIRHTVTVKKTGADKRKVEKVNMYFSPPMATSNSPTFGQSNSPRAGRSRL